MADGLSVLSGRAAPAQLDRFRLATAVLFGIAIGAIGVAIGLLAAGGGHRVAGARWSPWSPSTGGTTGATEIAERVAPLYRLTAADQLDVVTVMRLANPNDASATAGSGYTVAIGSGASATQNLSLLGGRTVAYDVCGLGASDCALAGTPSGARLLLLRREALELALYSFRYLPRTDNVIVVLPPGRTASSTASRLTATPPPASAPPSTTSSVPVTVAVLFVRAELAPWLATPLASTLSQYPPPVPDLSLWVKTQEAGLVDQITGHGLFSEQIETEQDGANLLVLNQLPPQ